MGVTPTAIYQTPQANLGSEFVNNLNYQNFIFQVMVRAEQQFSNQIGNLEQLYVRSINLAVPVRHGSQSTSRRNLDYPVSRVLVCNCLTG